MTLCFFAGACIGAIVGTVLLLAWAAFSVSAEDERAMRGHDR